MDKMLLFTLFFFPRSCGCNFQESCSNRALICFTFTQTGIPLNQFVSLNKGAGSMLSYPQQAFATEITSLLLKIHYV